MLAPRCLTGCVTNRSIIYATKRMFLSVLSRGLGWTVLAHPQSLYFCTYEAVWGCLPWNCFTSLPAGRLQAEDGILCISVSPGLAFLNACWMSQWVNWLMQAPLSISEQEFVYSVSSQRINRFVAFSSVGAMRLAFTHGGLSLSPFSWFPLVLKKVTNIISIEKTRRLECFLKPLNF